MRGANFPKEIMKVEHYIVLFLCERTLCDKKKEHIEVFDSEAGDYRSCSLLLDMCNLEMGLTSPVFFFFFA